MSIDVKYYSNLVSPFNQSKVLVHHEKLKELENNKIVSPITCEIDLTDGFCNNKCRHCFFGTDQKSIPVIMEKELAKSVIKELREMGTKAIEFVGGGEPLTHPDAHEIIEYAINMGFDVGIITNGLLLNKITDLIDRLSFVRISLDAACEETHTKIHGVKCFDTIIQNIKDVLKVANSNKVGLGFLIVPDNISDIVGISMLARELGVRFVQYRPASLTYEVDKEIWMKAEMEVQKAIKLDTSKEVQLFNAGIKWNHVNGERKFTKCHTSPIVSIIQANGDIPVCVLKRSVKDSIIGNIHNGGFAKNWFSKRHEELIDSIDLGTCRKPCKHDSYNIMVETLKNDYLHKNFV